MIEENLINLIKKMSQKNNLSFSKQLGHILESAFEHRRFKDRYKFDEALKEIVLLRSTINKIGINLNQLLKLHNHGKISNAKDLLLNNRVLRQKIRQSISVISRLVDSMVLQKTVGK